MYGKIIEEGGESYKLTKKKTKEQKGEKKLGKSNKRVDKIST